MHQGTRCLTQLAILALNAIVSYEKALIFISYTHKMTIASLSAFTAPGHWWSLRTARDQLATDLPKSRRSLERHLRALIGWPEAVTADSLRDHQDRPLNPLLLQRLSVDARRKRQHLLFAQEWPLPNGQPCLHVNDARGARYWYPLAKVRDDAGSELAMALAALGKLHPRGVIVLPHGSLARYRKVSASLIPWALYPSDVIDPLRPKTHTVMRSETYAESVLVELEAESLHILREALAGAQKPVTLFSAGKDSAVLLHLIRKACYPERPAVPLLHIDTRWKFRAMYRYRDALAKTGDWTLEVFTHPQAIKENINPFNHGPSQHTEITKTQALRLALDQGGYDTIIAGARRDEEASRAKERRFSIRAPGHRWDPRKQRPEPWNLYHSGLGPGESLRVFPLSNWTELDVWRYIARENLSVVELYFAAARPVVKRDGQWIMIDDERFQLRDTDRVEVRTVRFRSLGCYPLTAAVESDATTVDEIIDELTHSRQSERQGRVIDRDRPGSMELKKREGYF
jgi:sulfate adenylyltransferase subunit 2